VEREKEVVVVCVRRRSVRALILVLKQISKSETLKV
jgi:bisphosphoglycerate-dependent phosphoglycerate mutase